MLQEGTGPGTGVVRYGHAGRLADLFQSLLPPLIMVVPRSLATVPRRSRTSLVVLIGALGTVAGVVVTLITLFVN
ncbi:hypothetical protein [Streptomyces chartreusis]|uniref:hypothetical protein n=1 Tax=Streptomyces chartreusis TaxID=1969 RepID=UPI00381ECBC4